MKVLIFSFLLACASAQWYPYSGYYPGYFGSQYHSQDTLGQAAYGFAHPGQAANHYRDAFGNQVGSYAYINPEGKEVRVSYTADARGFRVLSNDLPVAPVANLKGPEPVQDTPEVAAAKATLFDLQRKAGAVVPESRKKRQVVAVVPTEQFKDDLKYKSVDLNQDGQPDVEVKPFYPAYRYGMWPHAYGTYPYTFGATPYSLSYPWAAPVAAAAEVKTTRAKRQVPFYPGHYALPYATHVAAPFVAPALAKTTLKTVTAEADLSAPTPADTNLLALKEKSVDVLTPYAYHGYRGAFPYYPYTL